MCYSRDRIMWFIAVLLAVGVVVAIASRRRSSFDPVDQQRQRLDALRAAVTTADPPGAEAARRTTRPLRAPRRWRPAPPSRALVAALTALVLVGGIGLVLALVSSGPDRSTSERRTRPRAEPKPTTSSTSTTSSTLPRAAVLGSDGGAVTISVPAADYVVRLTAHGSCWMRVQRPDDTVLDTTTLRNGDVREVAGSGPLTVRLGNPGVVDLAVDGEVLTLPARPGAPVDVRLVPPGAA
jgi:hypothetical protein